MSDIMVQKKIMNEAFRRWPNAAKAKVKQFSRMRQLTKKCLARLQHESRCGMSDATASAIIYVIHRNSRLLG